MIRYQCPHCQRICESADVMRGFSVFCLGCRQPVRVPAESTVTDAATPLPPAPIPPAPPVVASPMPTSPPKPPAPVKPKPIVAPPPVAPVRSRNWIVRGGLLVLMALLLIGGGVYGYRSYRQRKALRGEDAARQKLDDHKQTVRDNFGPDALKRLAAKHPSWEIAPSAPPRIKGKLVVLSLSDPADVPRSFWRDLLDHWPGGAPEDDTDLIRGLLQRGQVDEMMFELSEERWAAGPGEVDTIAGIRWRREAAPQELPDGPPAQRWRATVVLLDRGTSRRTARKEFIGSPPPAKPATGTKTAIGPRPFDEVRDWLRRVDAGLIKTP